MDRRLFLNTLFMAGIVLIFNSCNTTAQVTPTITQRSTLNPTVTLTQVNTTTTALEQAVSSLKGLDLKSFAEMDSETVVQVTQRITDAGQEGLRFLLQELVVMEQTGEKDSLFQQLAAWILWDIGQLDEAETIAEIWENVPVSEREFNLIFYPAMEAASTQDPRALPMLIVLTADQELHWERLEYPLTHEFLWGAYGSRAMPVLYEMLLTSDDPNVQESVIQRLSYAQYLPALPQIRNAINNTQPSVRNAAILALGLFGHPDDLDLLIAGLESKDAEELLYYVVALEDYGDIQVVPLLIPLLESEDQYLREWVAWGLGNSLVSPPGLQALKDHAISATDQDWKQYYEELVQVVLDSASLTWEQYENLSQSEQMKVTEDFRNFNNTLKEGETAISHDQFLEVVAEWRETGRISSVKWEWVETRHILPVATAEDIDLLLDGKAGFYLRLSDEAIEEARIVEDLIKWIGRSRYR